MGISKRLAYVAAGSIANAVVGIIYYRIGVNNVFDLAQNAHSGPFTIVVTRLELMVPIILAIIQLFLLAYLIIGGVQQERTQARQVVR